MTTDPHAPECRSQRVGTFAILYLCRGAPILACGGAYISRISKVKSRESAAPGCSPDQQGLGQPLGALRHRPSPRGASSSTSAAAAAGPPGLPKAVGGAEMWGESGRSSDMRDWSAVAGSWWERGELLLGSGVLNLKTLKPWWEGGGLPCKALQVRGL